MRMHIKSKQSGFTLIEILVGLVLTGVVSMGVISIMFLLSSSSTRVKQQDVLEQAKYTLQNELSDNIRWASSVTVLPSGNGFTTQSSDNTTNTYLWQNNQILKNSEVITSGDVVVTDMNVINKSLAPGLVSLDIALSLQQKSFSTMKSTAHIVVSQRQVTVKIQ